MGLAACSLPGNPAEGEKIATTSCRTCHELDSGGNNTGPSLQGLFGRKSGSVPGFDYSDAMKTANIVWTPETLDRFLYGPKTMVPGTKMSFGSMWNSTDRRDVISYLLSINQ
jgi:cytochrome c2